MSQSGRSRKAAAYMGWSETFLLMPPKTWMYHATAFESHLRATTFLSIGTINTMRSRKYIVHRFCLHLHFMYACAYVYFIACCIKYIYKFVALSCWFESACPWLHPTRMENIPSPKLTVYPWKWVPSQKERIVFQPFIVRCSLKYII